MFDLVRVKNIQLSAGFIVRLYSIFAARNLKHSSGLRKVAPVFSLIRAKQAIIALGWNREEHRG